ncbi:hypothetical protein TWF481_011571 [Arthrobotrys musiformis]|uniref:F-box domain-containing protein n=1 Tax=Arthrobotrys musiformis TaxID=47236 RepID=A0AAV9VZV3_9PEZI
MSRNPPKAPAIIPSAAQHALQIPEILEAIVIWSLHLHYVYDDRCRRVNQLRRVAKVWQMTVDHNPTLRTFAFRDPPNATSDSKTHLATFCRPYCGALEYELAAITELAMSDKTVGLSEFHKVSHSITMTHGSLIKGFRKKRKVPRCLASDIYITKPAVGSVYLRFSGSANSDWLDALNGIAKPTDFVHNLFDSFEYDYHIESPTGVNAQDLLGGIDKAVNSLYTLRKGSFLVQKIEVWIGNPALLKERPQSIPGWQIRKLWESKPWKS